MARRQPTPAAADDRPARPTAHDRAQARASAVLPREVRLIGGQWRRSKLPVADRPGLRPTPDRVRETLFNWLGQDLTGWRVLDAFAGSGALGFEAASRGAADVVLLERDAVLAASLRASQQRLKATALRVLGAEAVAWMKRAAPGSFELVLLDPPFDAGLAEAAVAAARPLLVSGGWLYLEAPEPLADLPAGLREHRALRAGAVCAQLLQVD
jgi:16S rRNA (guanine966-N2)-methyltransferase